MTDPALILSRCAHYLAEYAELMEEIEYEYDKGETDPVPELKDLAKRMRELRGDWDEKRAFGDAQNAARIIKSMLQEWALPGGVWFHKKLKRFRLVGEDYSPCENEECIGVYTPDANLTLLIEDFELVLGQGEKPRPVKAND